MSHGRKSPVGARGGARTEYGDSDFRIHSDYLTRLFGLVLVPGVIGLILGVAAASLFVHRVFPNVSAYPVQAGFVFVYVTLSWALLWQAQGKTLALWRRAWDSFERRLAEAREQAACDELTHLQNRRSFYDRLKQELESARSCRTPLAVLMLDMDDLKAINDDHGHQAGDLVLAYLARMIHQVARPQDLTARLGGDEFAIIMPKTDRRGADEIAARLWRELELNPVRLAEDAAVNVGVSIGISGFPWGGDTLESIIYWADAALYANKLARKGLDGSQPSSELKRVASAVVEVLSSALDIRDRLTHHHSRRVATLATTVAQQLELGEDEVRMIQQAAALHDIGKIGVPDSVLCKPAALDDEEWTEMRRHCELGYHILKGIEILSEAADIVYAHHERYDGAGYPRGLIGDEIPLGARVFAVVDAYDAMTSRRPYREATSREEALGEIALNAGSQFDPRVVAAFLEVMGRNGTSSEAKPVPLDQVGRISIPVSPESVRPTL